MMQIISTRAAGGSAVLIPRLEALEKIPARGAAPFASQDMVSKSGKDEPPAA